MGLLKDFQSQMAKSWKSDFTSGSALFSRPVSDPGKGMGKLKDDPNVQAPCCSGLGALAICLGTQDVASGGCLLVPFAPALFTASPWPPCLLPARPGHQSSFQKETLQPLGRLHRAPWGLWPCSLGTCKELQVLWITGCSCWKFKLCSWNLFCMELSWCYGHVTAHGTETCPLGWIWPPNQYLGIFRRHFFCLVSLWDVPGAFNLHDATCRCCSAACRTNT